MAESKRILSIDVLRGLVMVIMALDHVRDYFHIGANVDDPLNLATTTPLLFLTRWITHFCAPVFVFLSGTSVYLQSQRKPRKELSMFLIKRGLWLIAAECTIVAFAWTFNPQFGLIPFQVIWAIGISMVILGLIVRAGAGLWLIFIAGLLLVAGHNMLDYIEADPQFKAGFFWDLLHHGTFVPYEYLPGHVIMLVYPFPPWLGLMMLGYCLGYIYRKDYSSVSRQQKLITWGAIVIVTFIVLRLLNIYGDPVPWSAQKSSLYTFFSFINTDKYPPSLLYLCMIIGPALIMLALFENVSNGTTRRLIVFGRTPFFYYIVHIYLIHLLAAICFFARGHTFAQAGIVGSKFPFHFVAPGEGYDLGIVYIVWAAVVLALYPLCRYYDRYRSQHREKWWLSYL
jgi:uncharacterized membrane protein